MRALAKFHANGIALARTVGPGYAKKYPTLQAPPMESKPLIEYMSKNDNEVFSIMETALREWSTSDAPLVLMGSSGQEDAKRAADLMKKYLDERCPFAHAKIVESKRYSVLRNSETHPLRGFMFGDCWTNNIMFRYTDMTLTMNIMGTERWFFYLV